MITLTDLFCGAGGSSSGAVTIPGVRVRMAANHWALAIETHNSNHPDTDHDCADISQVDPRRYPRTDVLWASPECTNHSQARGKRREPNPGPDLFGDSLPDEAADRSRATMWDVVRFAEHHRYRAVLVENVVDAYHWAPFKAWLMAMDCLGYDHQLVWLNSMHAQAMGLPAPQSRDRMYVVFHQRGERRPDVARWTRPRAWCGTCEAVVSAVQSFKRTDRPAWGRYRAQYVYRCPNVACRNAVVEPGWLPAAAAIDWSLPGERIGDRARPLAAKTTARIKAGLAKYARPIHLEAAGNTYERPGYVRAWPVDEPLKTLHTTPSKGVAVPPFLIRHYTPRGQLAQMCTTVTAAAPTQTASFVPSLLVPAGGTWNDGAQPVTEPMRTRTTRETDAVVVPLRPPALVMRNNTGGAEMCTPVDEVLRTMTTAGHQSLIRWDDHMVVDYNGPARDVGEAMPTQTTVEGNALASVQVNVDDCLFRMLEPHEIAAAMAFPTGYVLLGNKRERVKLCGNAVTPPAARDLIAAVVEALTGVAPERAA